MKRLLLIISGLLLAFLELAIRIKFGSYSISILTVGLFALPLILTGNKKSGTIILLTGSLFLDIFSPFRPGWYLLFSVAALASIEVILARSFEISNPLINWLVLMLLFSILYIFQLFSNASIGLFLVTILLNATLATIISNILSRFQIDVRQGIRIGENVNIR